ncbi:MAG: hypothetical protein ACI9LM_001654 [Alteromonadaceae bacterium]|jgi:hypothetical protein
MKFFKSKKENEKKSSNEVIEVELLDLEDAILSETGGGNTPNIGCGVVQDNDSNNG